MHALTRKSLADVTRRKGRTLLMILGILTGVLGITAVTQASDQLGGAFFYSTDPQAVPNIVIRVNALPASAAQEDWFYRRSGTVVRSPFMLSSQSRTAASAVTSSRCSRT